MGGKGLQSESGRQTEKESDGDRSERERKREQMGPDSQRGVWPGEKCAVHSSSS